MERAPTGASGAPGARPPIRVIAGAPGVSGAQPPLRGALSFFSMEGASVWGIRGVLDPQQAAESWH